jgi:hypothetical protein
MPRYNFEVVKSYQVTAGSKEEALEMINSEQEYDYLVSEEWGEVIVKWIAIYVLLMESKQYQPQ